MLGDDVIEQAPDAYLARVGCVFPVFGDETQDSGHVSHGVQIRRVRYFVISLFRYFVNAPGRSDDIRPVLTYAERVSLLRNAVRLSRSCDPSALPRLHRVIESPGGPMLVYQWVEGEQVRSNPRRIRRLPAPEIVRLLDTVYQVHHQLARSGWVASDFYDDAASPADTPNCGCRASPAGVQGQSPARTGA